MSSAGKKVTRKERRRAELSAKLDQTLEKLERVAASGTNEQPRHAARHTDGNFWKARKDEKKRTLFVGGLPPQFRQDDVKALIDAIEDAVDSVEKVDFLGSSVPAFKQKGAKPRNAFVSFATIDAAMATQQRLDGFTVEGSTLRVNFSADKQQRAVAIAKRDGGDKHNFARRGGGRGFGGFGASRGRGRARGRT
uniref:RRM domain-containing protein n=1 Tax=Neobodo designis TaxID=312471 RepID=A0A7S1M043_NEODS